MYPPLRKQQISYDRTRRKRDVESGWDTVLAEVINRSVSFAEKWEVFGCFL